jgi:hypothetical protein
MQLKDYLESHHVKAISLARVCGVATSSIYNNVNKGMPIGKKTALRIEEETRGLVASWEVSDQILPNKENIERRNNLLREYVGQIEAFMGENT